jgi:hypothetical protein
MKLDPMKVMVTAIALAAFAIFLCFVVEAIEISGWRW